MEELKIATAVWKTLTSALTDDFERFKTSAKEGSTDVMEIARELELGQPGDVSELL